MDNKKILENIEILETQLNLAQNQLLILKRQLTPNDQKPKKQTRAEEFQEMANAKILRRAKK